MLAPPSMILCDLRGVFPFSTMCCRTVCNSLLQFSPQISHVSANTELDCHQFHRCALIPTRLVSWRGDIQGSVQKAYIKSPRKHSSLPQLSDALLSMPSNSRLSALFRATHCWVQSPVNQTNKQIVSVFLSCLNNILNPGSLEMTLTILSADPACAPSTLAALTEGLLPVHWLLFSH